MRHAGKLTANWWPARTSTAPELQSAVGNLHVVLNTQLSLYNAVRPTDSPALSSHLTQGLALNPNTSTVTFV